MQPVTVSQFTKKTACDVVSIARVCHAKFIPTYWSHQLSVENIAASCTGSIAYQQRVPVGCCIWDKREFTLELLLVTPGKRRTGIGGFLMIHSPRPLHVEIPFDHRMEWLWPWLARVGCDVSIEDLVLA